MIITLQQPGPSVAPTIAPSPKPSVAPTAVPSVSPSSEPSAPSAAPTPNPTPEPTPAGLIGYYNSNIGYYSMSIPAGMTSVRIFAYGAQGGAYSTVQGGLGGSIPVLLNVVPFQVLYVYVGGTTRSAVGGGNGGGNGDSSKDFNQSTY